VKIPKAKSKAKSLPDRGNSKCKSCGKKKVLNKKQNRTECDAMPVISEFNR
jgi:hypothetical protein